MAKRSADGSIKRSLQSSSCLYDTPWTVYLVTWRPASETCATLLSSPQARDRRARQLLDFLKIDAPTSEDEDGLERMGGLKECTWERIEARPAQQQEQLQEQDFAAPRQSENDGSGVYITLAFEKSTYHTVIYRSSQSQSPTLNRGETSTPPQHRRHHLPLLLTKTPAPLTKKILAFLTSTFHLTIHPLKFPSSVLQTTLHNYLGVFTTSGPPTTRSSIPISASLIKSVIRDVKITLSFSAPVAPALKTIDADLPAETVGRIIEVLRSKRDGTPSPSSSSSSSFMEILGAHLHHHTGLRLPRAEEMDGDDDDALIRISKIVCGAFAIGGDGKLKLTSRAVDVAEADEMGDLVEGANRGLVDAIVREAERRVSS